jgi:glucokinase-like ROK family protein
MSKKLLEVFVEENSIGVAYKNKSLKRSIISYLDANGNAPISDLSRELKISTPKITNLIAELRKDGLIKDYGKVNSTGGRRASVYGLVAEAGFFLGIDVKSYYINIGLLDFNKNLVNFKEKIPYQLQNTKESFKLLMKTIESYITSLHIRRNKILGMGINLSGRINHTTGYSYSFFNFQEEPLAKVIEAELGIPVTLENDSRAMAYGEFCCGVVMQEKNVLFVNMDYGIGLGILIDGKVYYGKSGFGGEFGHIPFFNNEIICHCGKKGCLETEASGLALLRNIRDQIQKGTSSQLSHKHKQLEKLTLYDVVDAANQDDMLAIEMLAQVGEKIGKGLAVLINIFNPELVILGGTLAETGDSIRLPIRSALNKFSLSLVNNDTMVRMSKLEERAGVMGGCLIARNKVFDGKALEA